jgi:carotenoid cleavage dioxygenase
LLVVPRDGTNADARWFDVAPCTISHTVNAFEAGNELVFDAVRAPRLMTPHALYRFTLNLATGRTSEQTLDPRFLDFPRVHPNVVGRRHRYVYTTELADFDRSGGFWRTVARQHDLETGASLTHEFDPCVMPGECALAPRSESGAENDAWVLLLAHQRDGQKTELVILDARDFAAPPVARIPLRRRVPFGLHGDWLADPSTALD